MNEVNKCFPVEIQDSEELWVSETDYDRLAAELAAIKAQEPFGYFQMASMCNKNIPELVESSIAFRNDPGVFPLYVAPTAKQVVMPERSNERGSDGELTYEAVAHNRCLDSVARLNAAPVQQVSVPDAQAFKDELEVAEYQERSIYGNWNRIYKLAYDKRLAAGCPEQFRTLSITADAQAIIDGLRGEVERISAQRADWVERATALGQKADQLAALLREIGDRCQQRDMPGEQTVADWACRIDAALAEVKQ